MIFATTEAQRRIERDAPSEVGGRNAISREATCKTQAAEAK